MQVSHLVATASPLSFVSLGTFTQFVKEKGSSKLTFDKMEAAWSYIGKLPILTRHTLNISLKVCYQFTLGCRNLDARVLKVITMLKLFSIVGVPFSLRSIQLVSEKIFRSYALDDKEGVALTSLSLTLIAADLVDSIATFINAVSMLMTNTSIKALSAMGMPLAFGMIGLGSVSRVIQLAKTHAVFKEFQKQELFDRPLSPDIKNLHQLLKEKLDLSETEIKAFITFSNLKHLSLEEIEAIKLKEIEKFKVRKKAALTRATNPQMIAELEKIYDLVKKAKPLTKGEVKELVSRMNRLQFFFKKKTTLDEGHLTANALNFIGVSLFYASLPPVLPFIFLALSIILRLSLLSYQDLAHAPKLSS